MLLGSTTGPQRRRSGSWRQAALPSNVYASGLHERISQVVGHRSSRAVAEATGANPESVRRYLGGQAPSIEFLQALCKAFGISGEWMLTGRGPMKAADAREAALRQADAGELLSALAEAVERLISRVDRLEQLIQIVEVRVRVVEARGPREVPIRGLKEEIAHGPGCQEDDQAAPFEANGRGAASHDGLAALRDALAKRPAPPVG